MRWYNYAEALAAARGKTLLRISIDEMAVCLHPGSGRGTGVTWVCYDVLYCIIGLPNWQRDSCAYVRFNPLPKRK